MTWHSTHYECSHCTLRENVMLTLHTDKECDSKSAISHSKPSTWFPAPRVGAGNVTPPSLDIASHGHHSLTRKKKKETVTRRIPIEVSASRRHHRMSASYGLASTNLSEFCKWSWENGVSSQKTEVWRRASRPLIAHMITQLLASCCMPNTMNFFYFCFCTGGHRIWREMDYADQE